MHSTNPNILKTPIRNTDSGTDNRSYTKSLTDILIPNSTENDKVNINIPIRATSESAGPYSTIYELPIDTTTTNQIKSSSICSSGYNSHSRSQYRPSSDTKPFERQLSLLDPNSDRVSTILVWQNLTVQIRENKRKETFQRMKSYKTFVPKRKCLLNNISGAIAGGLWAVMGPSGSGKSTLLNTLACRLDVNTVVEGEMRLNGAPYDNAELKRIAGYVMQDDLLDGYLTVEETLMYTAKLRLPRTFTNKQRKARVEEVMTDLGLSHVNNVIVGTPLKKGISGGERKRLCVGMQLLNYPQLLFLDEPTSGLDSVTALDLLRTFHRLAHGRPQEKAVTIVASIHQPQSKIFNLFDSLILLKAGNIIYQGPRKQVMDVYRTAGFPCPLYTNPADHLLDVITPAKVNPTLGGNTISLEQQATIDAALISAQSPLDIDLNMGVNKRLVQMNNLPLNPTWFKQIQILLQRNFHEQFRQREIILISLIQTIIMAILIGTVFLQIGHTQKSLLHRQPVIFFCAVNQGVFGALMVINSFPVERALTLRERASGTYYASAYFTAKIIADTLVQLPVPIIFSCIVYFLVGLQATVGKFFIFMLLMLLCSIAATSLALMVSTLCKTTDMSVTVLPLVLEITRLFGGFFLAPSRLPMYFSWLDALSYIKYTYVGASLNELEGLKLTCTNSERENLSCIEHGEYIINELGLNYLNIISCIGILILHIVICRLIAFLGVRFLKH